MKKTYLQDPDVTLYHGDTLSVLRELPGESVDCCVTSPPYWGLRDYGTPGQLGLEPTPEQYVERMVEVFREVRRVLAPHGTVWLNLGDSYAGGGRGGHGGLANLDRWGEFKPPQGDGNEYPRSYRASEHSRWCMAVPQVGVPIGKCDCEVSRSLKPKDLVGIPWRVAFALQADGWYLRSDIIWSKPNPMPESVTDRPTKAHEYVFLLSKQPRYFFDQEAVREAYLPASVGRYQYDKQGTAPTSRQPGQDTERGRRENGKQEMNPAGRNIRSVWEIATQPYPMAHFATFPEELARRCIAAGCPEQVCRVCGKARERVVESFRHDGFGHAVSTQYGDEGRHRDAALGPKGSAKQHRTDRETLGFTDCGCSSRDDGNEQTEVRRSSFASSADSKYRPGIVLDPFVGSGTTCHVARKLGRRSVGIDLSAEYLDLAARRLQQQSLFAGTM